MANTYVNGKVHVRKDRCKTCIYRPGNLMRLEDGRKEQMERDADADGGCIPCHSHIHRGEAVEPVCRGYFDHGVRGANLSMVLAEVMDVIEWVEDYHSPHGEDGSEAGN